MKNIIRTIINCILILVIIYCGYNIYFKLNDYKEADTTYKEVRSEKKESLNDINPDFKFWIKVDNTNIDYPVVQSSDNNYYLHKDFYKKDSSSGSIFLDYKNNLDDKNLILYGHNMKNKTMFNNLLNFKDENFFNQNNKIFIIKDDTEYVYKIFSVYTIHAGYDYLLTHFNNSDSFMSYINDIKSKSLFDSGIKINSDDSIITLSTCSYEFKDARTVIHGKLVK